MENAEESLLCAWRMAPFTVSILKIPLLLQGKLTFFFFFGMLYQLEARIAIDGEEIERVSNFEYLGARIEANGKSTPEIRRRLAKTTPRLTKLISIWKGQCKKSKLRVLETVVFPTVLYWCEAWTINNTDAKRITSFEMKCYRKILRISWMEKVTKKEVLSRLDMKTTMLLQKAKTLKLKYQTP